MEKKIVTFFMLMLCAIGAMAQQYSVQCQVNDSKGEGIPFATIYIYTTARSKASFQEHYPCQRRSYC